MSESQVSSSSSIPGFAVAGALICGLAGFACGLIAIINSADFVGGGICLLAGALAFGLLAGAVLRD